MWRSRSATGHPVREDHNQFWQSSQVQSSTTLQRRLQSQNKLWQPIQAAEHTMPDHPHMQHPKVLLNPLGDPVFARHSKNNTNNLVTLKGQKIAPKSSKAHHLSNSNKKRFIKSAASSRSKSRTKSTLLIHRSHHPNQNNNQFAIQQSSYSSASGVGGSKQHVTTVSTQQILPSNYTHSVAPKTTSQASKTVIKVTTSHALQRENLRPKPYNMVQNKRNKFMKPLISKQIRNELAKTYNQKRSAGKSPTKQVQREESGALKGEMTFQENMYKTVDNEGSIDEEIFAQKTLKSNESVEIGSTEQRMEEFSNKIEEQMDNYSSSGKINHFLNAKMAQTQVKFDLDRDNQPKKSQMMMHNSATLFNEQNSKTAANTDSHQNQPLTVIDQMQQTTDSKFIWPKNLNQVSDNDEKSSKNQQFQEQEIMNIEKLSLDTKQAELVKVEPMLTKNCQNMRSQEAQTVEDQSKFTTHVQSLLRAEDSHDKSTRLMVYLKTKANEQTFAREVQKSNPKEKLAKALDKNLVLGPVKSPPQNLESEHIKKSLEKTQNTAKSGTSKQQQISQEKGTSNQVHFDYKKAVYQLLERSEDQKLRRKVKKDKELAEIEQRINDMRLQERVKNVTERLLSGNIQFNSVIENDGANSNEPKNARLLQNYEHLKDFCCKITHYNEEIVAQNHKSQTTSEEINQDYELNTINRELQRQFDLLKSVDLQSDQFILNFKPRKFEDNSSLKKEKLLQKVLNQDFSTHGHNKLELKTLNLIFDQINSQVRNWSSKHADLLALLFQKQSQLLKENVKIIKTESNLLKNHQAQQIIALTTYLEATQQELEDKKKLISQNLMAQKVMQQNFNRAFSLFNAGNMQREQRQSELDKLRMIVVKWFPNFTKYAFDSDFYDGICQITEDFTLMQDKEKTFWEKQMLRCQLDEEEHMWGLGPLKTLASTEFQGKLIPERYSRPELWIRSDIVRLEQIFNVATPSKVDLAELHKEHRKLIWRNNGTENHLAKLQKELKLRFKIIEEYKEREDQMVQKLTKLKVENEKLRSILDKQFVDKATQVEILTSPKQNKKGKGNLIKRKKEDQMLKKSLSFSQKDIFPDLKAVAPRRVTMMGFRHRPDDFQFKNPKSPSTRAQNEQSPGSKIEQITERQRLAKEEQQEIEDAKMYVGKLGQIELKELLDQIHQRVSSKPLYRKKLSYKPAFEVRFNQMLIFFQTLMLKFPFSKTSAYQTYVDVIEDSLTDVVTALTDMYRLGLEDWRFVLLQIVSGIFYNRNSETKEIDGVLIDKFESAPANFVISVLINSKVDVEKHFSEPKEHDCNLDIDTIIQAISKAAQLILKPHPFFMQMIYPQVMVSSYKQLIKAAKHVEATVCESEKLERTIYTLDILETSNETYDKVDLFNQIVCRVAHVGFAELKQTSETCDEIKLEEFRRFIEEDLQIAIPERIKGEKEFGGFVFERILNYRSTADLNQNNNTNRGDEQNRKKAVKLFEDDESYESVHVETPDFVLKRRDLDFIHHVVIKRQVSLRNALFIAVQASYSLIRNRQSFFEPLFNRFCDRHSTGNLYLSGTFYQCLLFIAKCNINNVFLDNLSQNTATVQINDRARFVISMLRKSKRLETISLQKFTNVCIELDLVDYLPTALKKLLRGSMLTLPDAMHRISDSLFEINPQFPKSNQIIHHRLSLMLSSNEVGKVLDKITAQFAMPKIYCPIFLRERFQHFVYELFEDYSIAQTLKVYMDCELMDITQLVRTAIHKPADEIAENIRSPKNYRKIQKQARSPLLRSMGQRNQSMMPSRSENRLNSPQTESKVLQKGFLTNQDKSNLPVPKSLQKYKSQSPEPRIRNNLTQKSFALNENAFQTTAERKQENSDFSKETSSYALNINLVQEESPSLEVSSDQNQQSFYQSTTLKNRVFELMKQKSSDQKIDVKIEGDYKDEAELIQTQKITEFTTPEVQRSPDQQQATLEKPLSKETSDEIKPVKLFKDNDEQVCKEENKKSASFKNQKPNNNLVKDDIEERKVEQGDLKTQTDERQVESQDYSNKHDQSEILPDDDQNQFNIAQDILLKPLDTMNSNSGKLTPIIEPRLKIQVNKTAKNSPTNKSNDTKNKSDSQQENIKSLRQSNYDRKLLTSGKSRHQQTNHNSRRSLDLNAELGDFGIDVRVIRNGKKVCKNLARKIPPSSSEYQQQRENIKIDHSSSQKNFRDEEKIKQDITKHRRRIQRGIQERNAVFRSFSHKGDLLDQEQVEDEKYSVNKAFMSVKNRKINQNIVNEDDLVTEEQVNNWEGQLRGGTPCKRFASTQKAFYDTKMVQIQDNQSPKRTLFDSIPSDSGENTKQNMERSQTQPNIFQVNQVLDKQMRLQDDLTLVADLQRMSLLRSDTEMKSLDKSAEAAIKGQKQGKLSIVSANKIRLLKAHKKAKLSKEPIRESSNDNQATIKDI